MKEKLLVVDDDPTIRRVLRRILEGAGFVVLEAADGLDVAEMTRRERPDCVLLDMHMPELDGISALSQILEIDQNIPVIVMTGDTDASRAKMALERGACDFLTKPLDFDYVETSVLANVTIRKKT